MSEQESFTFNYRNVEHTALSIGADRLPELNEIISVHALPFTPDGGVVVVNVRSRGVDMVGGHVEKGETSAIQTLTRELSEEAALTIRNPALLDVLEVSSSLIKPEDRRYIVIYSADIDKLGDFVASEEIEERLVLDADEFSEQYFAHAPSYIKHLFALAIKA